MSETPITPDTCPKCGQDFVDIAVHEIPDYVFSFEKPSEQQYEVCVVADAQAMPLHATTPSEIKNLYFVHQD